jgi:hypothetical protein
MYIRMYIYTYIHVSPCNHIANSHPNFFVSYEKANPRPPPCNDLINSFIVKFSITLHWNFVKKNIS